MNLHFEDRQKLRALSQPVEPARDLWPQIAARIESQPRASRQRFQWFAMAASFAGVAVLAGVIGTRMMHADRAPVSAVQSNAFIAANDAPGGRWKPADPRLRGAAVELHAAQGELKQALAIAPHADYLQQLLERTERQQSHLQRLEHEAG
ncbi:MAG TPA: hypothetical protein VJ727_05380 [Rhodanobacteraceae bacterium]|nr:hypothetical protein [Rhodanobacteraceae bacterium]